MSNARWWSTLIVPSAIALITGFKAEIAEQFHGWWTALTPWRFLFWGSIVWIFGWLVARFLLRPISQIKTGLADLTKGSLRAEQRLQATEMKLGIYPGDKKDA
jgi:hypothetical protein